MKNHGFQNVSFLINWSFKNFFGFVQLFNYRWKGIKFNVFLSFELLEMKNRSFNHFSSCLTGALQAKNKNFWCYLDQRFVGNMTWFVKVQKCTEVAVFRFCLLISSAETSDYIPTNYFLLQLVFVCWTNYNNYI